MEQFDIERYAIRITRAVKDQPDPHKAVQIAIDHLVQFADRCGLVEQKSLVTKIEQLLRGE